MHIEAAFNGINEDNPNKEEILVRTLPMSMFLEDSLC